MLPKHQGPTVPANWPREPQPLLHATRHPEWVKSQDRSREKNYHAWRAGRVFDRRQKPWIQRSLKEHMSVDKLTTKKLSKGQGWARQSQSSSGWGSPPSRLSDSFRTGLYTAWWPENPSHKIPITCSGLGASRAPHKSPQEVLGPNQEIRGASDLIKHKSTSRHRI